MLDKILQSGQVKHPTKAHLASGVEERQPIIQQNFSQTAWECKKMSRGGSRVQNVSMQIRHCQPIKSSQFNSCVNIRNARISNKMKMKADKKST